LPDNPARRRDRAANAVEQYLATHPAAADGVHGIAQWWLPAFGVDLPESVVAEALQDLLSRGRISCETPPGGDPIWRAAVRQA